MPLLTSVPITPISTPSTTIAMPLTGAPDEIVEAATSPRSIIEKYSGAPNFSATSAIAGENSIRMMMPTVAPKNEAIVVMNSATPARPFWAIG